jgi:phage tail P2-like protein
VGKPSALGFGHQLYGHPRGGTPFKQKSGQPYKMLAGYGSSDWAEEVTWRVLPWFYGDEDGVEGKVAEPLRGYIDAIKPLFNEIRNKWAAFPDLWDANKCPIDQLPMLAYSVGWTLAETQSEQIQRSQILNAPQLYIHKGTDLGYQILAAFEDLLVEIIPLWWDGSNLSPDDPTLFVPRFSGVPADDVACDSEFDDRFAIWPNRLYVLGGQRTAILRLIFYPTDSPAQDFDADVASRVAERLLRFKPLHVEINRIVFDGLRGSSQSWTTSVVGDNSAAGMWADSVSALLSASSQPWTAPVVSTTSP